MLLRILEDMEGSDVLDDILKSLNVDYPKLVAKFSTQESLNSNDSCASTVVCLGLYNIQEMKGELL